MAAEISAGWGSVFMKRCCVIVLDWWCQDAVWCERGMLHLLSKVSVSSIESCGLHKFG